MNRAELLEAHADTTRGDVALALALAETPEEVDAAAHISLALFGVGGTLAPFVDHGRSWSSLHVLTTEARSRVRGFHGDVNERMHTALDNAIAAAKARRRRERKEEEAARQRLRA